ncbi:MAG: hypothetical protein IT237_12645 [Bacteroidia bacterium]|nr:hypothetical protein [Bacteroidia bacterium]
MMKSFIIKYKLALLGLVIGAIAGYAYYYFVGCASGTCAITSNPYISTVYGAFMGFLLLTSFKSDVPKKINQENEK